MGGDFSSSSRQIFDPFTTKADPNNPGTFLRDPFPNNRIPANRINASTKAWADAVIPAPVQTSVPGFNHLNTDKQKDPADQFNVRVDQNFTPKDFMWFRATWGNQNRTQTQAIAGTNLVSEIPVVNIGASYTHIFGVSTVFNTLFGYSGMTQDDAFFITEQDLIGKGLFEGMAKTVNAPHMSLPNYFGLTSDIRTFGPQDAWQYRADLSHVKGNHTLKFGGEVIVQPWAQFNTNSQLTFSTAQSADLSRQGSTGDDAASFLLGVYDQAGSTNTDFALKSTIGNFFVQDTWKVTNNLTLNMGLRWDLLIAPEYSLNASATWDFNTGKYIVGRPTPPPCASSPPPCLVDPNNEYNRQYVVFKGTSKQREDQYKMLGPRFGFAYRARPTLVVRGSFAILFDLISGVNQQGQSGSRWPKPDGISRLGANRTVVEYTADRPFGAAQSDLPEPTPQNNSGFL